MSRTGCSCAEDLYSVIRIVCLELFEARQLLESNLREQFNARELKL